MATGETEVKTTIEKHIGPGQPMDGADTTAPKPTKLKYTCNYMSYGHQGMQSKLNQMLNEIDADCYVSFDFIYELRKNTSDSIGFLRKEGKFDLNESTKITIVVKKSVENGITIKYKDSARGFKFKEHSPDKKYFTRQEIEDESQEKRTCTTMYGGAGRGLDMLSDEIKQRTIHRHTLPRGKIIDCPVEDKCKKVVTMYKNRKHGGASITFDVELHPKVREMPRIV